MDEQKILELALQTKEFEENTFDYIKLAKIAGFNEDEIEYIKLFWGAAFNKSWIFMHKEIVIDWMGYKKNDFTMSDFYKNLKKNYEVEIDYKEVDKNNEMVKFHQEKFPNRKVGNRTKYYIITGSCLKLLLMSAPTSKSKLIKNLYIKTETLVSIMNDIIKAYQTLVFQQQLEIKDKEIQDQAKLLENANIKTLDLKSEIKNSEIFKEDGYIYLTTTKQYSRYNVFRLGRTMNLNRRLQHYEIGRVQDDKPYYVYVFKTANHELIEFILRKFLKKYMEDSTSNKDMYILPFCLLKPFIENVCRIFNDNMIPIANDMIEANIDFIDQRKLGDVGPIISPYIYSKNRSDFDDDEIDDDFFNSQPCYYEDIIKKYSIYPGIEIITPKEEVHTMFSTIDIKCPHTRRQVQVRALLNSIGCPDCVKDKALLEKTTELLTEKLETFDDYDVIAITEISEDITGFERTRLTFQNKVIKKLKKENIALISEYVGAGKKFHYLCSYGHKHTTSWDTFSKKKDNFCKICNGIKAEIIKSAKNKRATDDDLIKMANEIGWTHIRRSGKKGIYEWECPKGHLVVKDKRELLLGRCTTCIQSKKKK